MFLTFTFISCEVVFLIIAFLSFISISIPQRLTWKMDPLGLILILIFCLVISFIRKTNRNFPPGPRNWFGIGGLLALQRADPVYPHVALAKLAKKYGPIMLIQLGVNPTVVVSRYEDILHIFNQEEFQARYEFCFARDRAFGKELGILMSSHGVWREVRSFSQKRLRDFGFRKSQVLGTLIESELMDFLDSFGKLAKDGGGIVWMENRFTTPVINVIWNLVFGFQSKECEVLLQRFLENNSDVVRTFAHDNITHPFPFLRNIFPVWTGHGKAMKAFTEQQQITRELIAESQQRQSGDEDPFNFVQSFQKEIERNKWNPDTHFTDEQLIMTLSDIFLAGSETTSHFLGFAILHLVLQPQIQKRIQEEIREIVGGDGGIPCYADAERMPYTQAFMFEVFRFCNIAPIPLARRTEVDYEYKGYTIPKGACVMYNLHVVFNDVEYWGDPLQFRPERFLDPDTGKLRGTERVAVFGFGKRFCIGDIVAKQTGFVYLTGLLSRFTFGRVPGEDPPSAIPLSSFTSKPRPFNVQVTQNV